MTLPLSLGKLDCFLDVTLRTATGALFLNPSFFQIQYWRPLIFCKIQYWAEKNLLNQTLINQITCKIGGHIPALWGVKTIHPISLDFIKIPSHHFLFHKQSTHPINVDFIILQSHQIGFHKQCMHPKNLNGNSVP